LADKIATTFHLDKSKVQSVIDEDRQTHHAEREAKQAAALQQAVTDGKLTQAQADHITTVWKEIKDLRGTTKPQDMSTATRDQIKQKMDDLQTWLKDQNIDLRSFGVRGHGHGFGGHKMDADDTSSSSTSSSSTSN
jgi:plasmid replication initiation protein